MRILLLALLVALSAGLSGAQYHNRRSVVTATPIPGARKGVIVSFHGALKKMSKREILIQSENNQLLTFRCSKSTRYMRNDREIKAYEIDLESPVVVDASEDNDLKLMAVNVKVEQPVKPAGPPR